MFASVLPSLAKTAGHFPSSMFRSRLSSDVCFSEGSKERLRQPSQNWRDTSIAVKAADGLLVARGSVGNSEGRPETASIESAQSVMLAVLERHGGWAQPDPSIYAGAGRLRHQLIAVDATPSPRLRLLVGVSFTPSTRADARCGTPPTMEKAPHLTQNHGW